MHAVHTCQGCRARRGLQEPKPSEKDNPSLTPPKQVLPQLTGMELKSHTATCTSTLYPFYFNLGSFKYVYSSFTFPSTLLFSPMQWNLWLMCWPHFLPEWWARKGRTQVDRVSGRCRQAEGRRNSITTVPPSNSIITFATQLPLSVVSKTSKLVIYLINSRNTSGYAWPSADWLRNSIQ